MGDAYDDYEADYFARLARTEIALDGARLRDERKPQQKIVWVDKQGNRHDPKTMSLGHLRNCIKLCERRGQEEFANVLRDILNKRTNADG